MQLAEDRFLSMDGPAWATLGLTRIMYIYEGQGRFYTGEGWSAAQPKFFQKTYSVPAQIFPKKNIECAAFFFFCLIRLLPDCRWRRTPLDEDRIGGNKKLIKLLEVARASQLSEF